MKYASPKSWDVVSCLAVVAALAAPAASYAAAAKAPAGEPENVIGGVSVKAATKPRSTSLKRTQPLLDTPQTVDVIKRELFEQQGATSLADALRNTPGITYQQGEKDSNVAGDTFQMRGFSAQTSVFLDGVRDLGAISRDIYNVEQIEVVKGANGSETGRGASAGYINLVSKSPKLAQAASASLVGYTQGGSRGALDANLVLGETSALRLNLMAQTQQVAGRSRQVTTSGYAIAPAYALGLGSNTRFFLLGQYIKQDNAPYAGIPTIGMKGFYNANPLLNAGARVNRENFYGSRDDFENVEAVMITTKIEHDVDNGVTVTNTSRYGRTAMDRVMSSIYTSYAAPSADPATWTTAIQRQGFDQENNILANQTNIRADLNIGPWRHALSSGLEFSYERQYNGAFERPFTGGKSLSGAVIPALALYAPDNNLPLPTPQATGGYTEGETRGVAVYAFDTVTISDALLLNAGGRLDDYDTRSTTVTPANGVLTPSSLSKKGLLSGWNLGAVYKPRPNASLYVAYSTSQTPPGSANFALEAAGKSANNAAFDPQETTNSEIGVKWDLMGGSLSLTGAYYDTVHKNELAQLDSATNSYVQLGQRSIKGVEFAAVGRLSAVWDISAGLQTLSTRIDKGVVSGDNSAGAGARWSPKLTGAIWTSYRISPKIALSGGARYVSDQKREVNPAAVLATSVMPKIPAYWVLDAAASYDLTRRVSLRLNVYNLLNKDYINTLSANGLRATLGASRSASLSVGLKF